jgi:hypothetical protein
VLVLGGVWGVGEVCADCVGELGGAWLKGSLVQGTVVYVFDLAFGCAVVFYTGDAAVLHWMGCHFARLERGVMGGACTLHGY